MKQFEHTGEKFVERIFNDHGDVQFIAAAFVGDRALGEGYSASKECGCKLELHGKFTFKDSYLDNIRKVTGDLLWKPEQYEPTPPSFGNVKSTFFRPVSGELTVEESFINPGLAGSFCHGAGRKTFSVEQLRPGALRHMLLEVAADGRYKMTLIIPDHSPDPFPTWEFETECVFPT